jgi:hypothetical protein
MHGKERVREGRFRGRPAGKPRSRLVMAMVAMAVWAGNGCAPVQGGDSLRANSSIISEEEIRASSGSTVFDVVERLRPLWLRTGPQRSSNLPTEVVVIVNDMYFGTAESLRSMSPETIYELRYLDAAAATARLPRIEASRHVAGAIVVQINRQ